MSLPPTQPSTPSPLPQAEAASQPISSVQPVTNPKKGQAYIAWIVLSVVVIALAAVLYVVLSADSGLLWKHLIALMAAPETVVTYSTVPGSDFRIKLARLSKPGFVAVFLGDSFSSWKNLVGRSQRLPAGVAHDVTIVPMSPHPESFFDTLPSGTKLVVALYYDDGDNDLRVDMDTAVTDSAGDVISAQTVMR